MNASIYGGFYDTFVDDNIYKLNVGDIFENYKDVCRNIGITDESMFEFPNAHIALACKRIVEWVVFDKIEGKLVIKRIKSDRWDTGTIK